MREGCDDPTCENVESCIIDMMDNSECPEGHYCSTACCFAIVPG
ncbi:hypothetical protein [Nannocystis radixulma]|uniref:WAP domain-containing protein n=1 Tax=Nannocystis radixulma TaxID=2995305 RepID=A0ABT5B8H1_9BACT|nr:hypothetical protein [Nannocystis radixulma]MDC0669758.1 hypothetical protein [Nannocystis radixulma]